MKLFTLNKKLLTILVLLSATGNTQAHSLRAVAALARLATAIPHAVDAQCVASVVALNKEYETRRAGLFAKKYEFHSAQGAQIFVQDTLTLACQTESLALDEIFEGVQRIELEGVAETLKDSPDALYGHYIYIRTLNECGRHSPEHLAARAAFASGIIKNFIASIPQ